MNRVISIVKPLSVMIAIQAACLAFGLWLHGQFVIASAQWASNEQVWAELLARAEEIRPRTLSLKAGDFVADGERFEKAVVTVSAGELPEGMNLIVVDTDWRLLFSSRLQDDGSTFHWKAGDTVEQEELAGLKYTRLQALRGVVRTETEVRQALGWSLEDGSGYVALYGESAAPEPTVEMITDSLLVGIVVAFLWIAGLQGIGMYIVMVRTYTAPPKTAAVSDESLRRAQDLVRTRDAVIIGLAKLAEARDTDTGHHLERIGLYCTSLASSLRRRSEYRALVSPGFSRLIRVSSALHDIGKVGITDAILLKPAKLTEEERLTMQEHAQLGGKCIRRIEQQLGTSNFLGMAREIALYHHECWDGSGYPFGKKGEEIPLAARIVAIADVYDALAFKRVYKTAMRHEECVELIRKGSGSKFDPKLVQVFLEIENQFREIGQAYSGPRIPGSAAGASGDMIESIGGLDEEVLAAL